MVLPPVKPCCTSAAPASAKKAELGKAECAAAAADESRAGDDGLGPGWMASIMLEYCTAFADAGADPRSPRAEESWGKAVILDTGAEAACGSGMAPGAAEARAADRPAARTKRGAILYGEGLHPKLKEWKCRQYSRFSKTSPVTVRSA